MLNRSPLHEGTGQGVTWHGAGVGVPWSLPVCPDQCQRHQAEAEGSRPQGLCSTLFSLTLSLTAAVLSQGQFCPQRDVQQYLQTFWATAIGVLLPDTRAAAEHPPGHRSARQGTTWPKVTHQYRGGETKIQKWCSSWKMVVCDTVCP